MNGKASTILPHMEGSVFWTFEAVEERLVDALLVARRVSDREAGWLRVKACWPDVLRASWLGDYGGEGVDGASEARLRPLPLSGARIDAAGEAEGWLGRYLADEADRLIVRAALGWKAGGRRVGWKKMGRVLGMGMGEASLARRYVLAISRIACGLNGKGEAAARAMARRRMAGEAARALADGGRYDGHARKGRRRKQVYEIVYDD